MFLACRAPRFDIADNRFAIPVFPRHWQNSKWGGWSATPSFSKSVGLSFFCQFVTFHRVPGDIKKSQTARPLLFVDTNIFLDFYRWRGEAGLTLLNHIDAVSDVLILTDQVEAEFLNNRRTVILEALDSLKPPVSQLMVPAYLSDSRANKAIDTHFKRIRKCVEQLKKRVSRLLEEPKRYDPVFKAVKRAMDKQTGLMNLNLDRENQDTKNKIHELALKRFQKGLPPRRKDTGSIGDAINWEWVLSCAIPRKRDVLVVSRDKDYGIPDKNLLNEFLAHEFRSKGKGEAFLVPSLAEALKRLHVKVTAAEEKVEQSRIDFAGSPVFNIIVGLPSALWEIVLRRVSNLKPEIRPLFDKTTCTLLDNGEFTVVFPGELRNDFEKVNNEETRSLIMAILKELGYSGKVTKVTFALDVMTEGYWSFGASGWSLPPED